MKDPAVKTWVIPDDRLVFRLRSEMSEHQTRYLHTVLRRLDYDNRPQSNGTRELYFWFEMSDREINTITLLLSDILIDTITYNALHKSSL